MTRTKICFISAWLLLLLENRVMAQKAPELGYVFPPVVKTGQTTSVQLGGYDFTPDMQFFVHDEQIHFSVLGPPGEFIIAKPPYWFGEKGGSPAFPIPREIPAQIHVPDGARPGLVRWQVANANGSSATAVLFVSDSQEIVEQRHRDQPQPLVRLPVSVSGRIEKIAEVDRYAITAERDGPITIELFARRLGADFHGILEVRDVSGRVLADAADTEGLDLALTFAARQGETYEIRLFDVDYRGNRAHVYRLVVTPGPRVVTTIPAAARRGSTQDIQFIGYGVATGAAQLEATSRTITFPTEPTSRAFRYELATEFGMAAPYEIPLSDLNELGSIPNLSPPCAVTVRLDKMAEQAFTWEAKQGEMWRFSAQSRAIGTDLDLSISLRDSAGKQLVEIDDLPGTPDAGVDFTAPAEGKYTCVITDRSGRVGELASIFRLAVEKVEPGFHLTVPQQLNIPIAGQSPLKVTAVRSGGFSDDIALEVRGLPAGVSVPGDLKIPKGQNDLTIPLNAAADAASQATRIQIIGTAQIGDQSVTHVATALAAGSLAARERSDHYVSHILLATTMKPPFSLELVDKNRQRDVHRGTTYPAPFNIVREAGFTGALTLQMAARQQRHVQGMHGPMLQVPAGVDQVLYPCFMPEWLATDRTTRMIVMGVAEVPDPQGNVRHLLKNADGNVTMILEGALLGVRHRAEELTVNAGDVFEIPVAVARSAKLPTAVSIELLVPEELAGLVEGVPVRLEASQSETAIRVSTANDDRLTGRWPLQVRATAMQDGRWPVVALADVAVEFVPSSEARP